MGDKYKRVRVMYGKKLAMSRKYTLMQEIVTASPNANNMVISSTGIAQNISQANGRPKTVLIARKTARVGRNLKIAITTAETGNIMRGKAVFRIKRWPAVIDFTPPVKELATK
jgi:hypothetical protein